MANGPPHYPRGVLYSPSFTNMSADKVIRKLCPFYQMISGLKDSQRKCTPLNYMEVDVLTAQWRDGFDTNKRNESL